MTANRRRSDTTTVADTLRAVGAAFLERGWLSANNILFLGDGPSTLIDSGYGSHAEQTLALVSHHLSTRPLDLLLNTHLHSDHCGGNAALQQRYQRLRTLIPPGQAEAVRSWDEDALTYKPTGQHCPRFVFEDVLRPGQRIHLGSHPWDVYGAKGHDPHAIVLHQPDHRILISADALWQNGFGVVFPELEGVTAFNEVAETLDLIEELAPQTVIPGHGSVFQDVPSAITRARTRLESFQSAPDKHRRHAMKVLIKFRLLEWQKISMAKLLAWAQQTPYLAQTMPTDQDDARQWLASLLTELVASNALEIHAETVVNSIRPATPY